MKISDIIALATHGYKPADIKDVMAKSDNIKTDDIITLAKQGYKPGEIVELLEVVKDAEPDEEKPEDKKEKKPEAKPEDNADAEALKKELDGLKAQLKAAQNANVRKGREENEKSDDEVIADICRSFM